jgi:hypothetical protein
MKADFIVVLIAAAHKEKKKNHNILLFAIYNDLACSFSFFLSPSFLVLCSFLDRFRNWYLKIHNFLCSFSLIIS